MKKTGNQLSILLVSIGIFLVGFNVNAQCTFTVSKTNNNTSFEQWFILVDSDADTIVSVIPADMMGAATFTTPSNGSYNVHAINYDPNDPPVPFPTIGDDPTLTGSTSGCFNDNFVSDIKPIECQCEGPSIAISYNNAPGYEVIYILAQTDGTILAFNDTGTFSPSDGLNPPETRVYALHYNSNDPPVPIVGSNAGDLMAGANIADIGSTYAGCFTPLENPLCVYFGDAQPTITLQIERVCDGNMIYVFDPAISDEPLDITGLIFEWYLDDELVGTTTEPFFSPQESGDYTLIAYNSENCTPYEANFYPVSEIIDCRDCGKEEEEE